MNIELSFSLHEKDYSGEDPLYDVYDLVLEGDLTFKIDQTDFSLEEVYIVNYMICLYLSCRSCIANHDQSSFIALETPVDVRLEYIENNSAQLSYEVGGTIASSVVDLSELFEKAKTGLIEALAALYSVYPHLSNGYSHLETLHIEQDLIEEAILRSKA